MQYLHSGCDVINFENNLIFLIKLFFSAWPKSQDKNVNILRMKRAFKIRWNQKHFSSFLKCYQTIAIHILPSISRSEGKQAMKFGQLIEYNMRNIFVEKSYTKCGRETVPRPFSGKPKLSKSLPQKFKVLYSLLLSYAKLRTIKIYWN